MTVKLVDDLVNHIYFDSRYLLYSSIVALACLDVLSTYAASIVMGRFFAEVGLVASFLMGESPDLWPLFMFLSESVIFGATAYFFARGNNRMSTMKMWKWKIRLAYLPTLTLLTLVLNNTVLIILFSLGLFK